MGLERYWEEYEVGEIISTSGRTLTEADIRLFIGATDATHPAHVDSEYCKKHPFKKIVVPGALTMGVIDGFVTQDLVPRKLNIGHYGYDKVRFLRPVYPGDTIKMKAEVLEKKERNQEFGIVKFEYQVENQHDVLVLIVHDLQMIERMSN